MYIIYIYFVDLFCRSLTFVSVWPRVNSILKNESLVIEGRQRYLVCLNDIDHYLGGAGTIASGGKSKKKANQKRKQKVAL